MAAPRKHPPANAIPEIERLAAQGYSIVGIAHHLGVASSTFKRWCEEDEKIQNAFEVGRETERQALHALIIQSAVANKPANANAMFLLKCRHGYREFDAPNTKVDVAVNAPQSVLLVRDHGSDEEWAAKCVAQQKALLEGDMEPRLLQAPQTAQLPPGEAAAPPVYVPPAHVLTAPPAPAYAPAAPSWKGNS